MLTVELSVAPKQVGKDAQLDIRGAVRNNGSSPIDTRIWNSTLLVDGIPCEHWAWAIANGIRDEREFALPPGEQVVFRRLLPVTSVLLKPGHHDLVLVVRDVSSPRVTVVRRDE